MGDAGEGLIDADARIQERRDQLEQAKKEARDQHGRDPVLDAQVESLRLARAELARQLEATSNERRRAVIVDALAELDRRMAELQAKGR
jgi:hypothetical protein